MALRKRILLVDKQKHGGKGATTAFEPSSPEEVTKYLGSDFWKSLFDDSPDVVFLCDKEHRFVYCNETTQRLLGHKEGGRCDCMSVQDIMEEDSLAIFRAAEKRMGQSGSIECDLTLRAQNGKQISVRGTLQSLVGLTKGRFRDVSSEERAMKLQRLYLNIMDFNVSYRSIESLYERIFKKLEELFDIKHFAVVYKDSSQSKQTHTFVHNHEGFHSQNKVLQSYLCEMLSEEVLSRKHSLIVLEKHISRVVGRRFPKSKIPHVWVGMEVPFSSPEVQAVVCFFSYEKNTMYSPIELSITEFVGKQVSVALERKLSESRLEQQDARLLSIFESNTHQMWSVDRSYRLSSFNHWFKRTLSRFYNLYPKIGDNFVDLLGHTNASISSWRIQYERAFSGQVANFKTTLVRPDGVVVWIDVFLNPISLANGTIREVSAIANDVTKLKKANDQLVEAKETAEHLLKVKRNFLANMSHEIRTPLNGIMGMLTLLETADLNDVQRDYVDVIRRSSNTLLDIINDILNLSKIEAGKMDLRPRPASLRDIFKKVHDLFKQNKTEIFSHISGKIPDLLLVDETRLVQILTNLMSNAVKFSVKDKKKVHLNAYLVAQTRQRLCVKVKVKDYGVGILERDKKFLFKSFQQLETSTTKSFGGTGLGLTISKELVKLMKGDVGVHSVFGKGSTFWFTFWAEACMREEELEAHDLPRMQQKTRSSVKLDKDPCILIVDDNASNRRVASELLEKAGAKTVTASSGEEALEEVKKQGFDLILMDIQMPRKDGIDTAKDIKSLPQASPPIIAMTAYAMEKDRARLLKKGMDDYISKPIDYPLLVQKINDWLKDSGEQKQTLMRQSVSDKSKRLSPPPERFRHVVNKVYIENVVRHAGKKVFMRALSDFVSEGKTMVDACRRVLKKSDTQQLAREIHTLKGASASVGMQDIHTQCQKIEQALQTHGACSLEPLNAAWHTFLEEETHIRKWLNGVQRSKKRQAVVKNAQA